MLLLPLGDASVNDLNRFRQPIVAHGRVGACASPFNVEVSRQVLNVDAGKPRAIFSRTWLLPTKLNPQMPPPEAFVSTA